MSKKIQFLMVAIALASPTSQAVPQEIFSDLIENSQHEIQAFLYNFNKATKDADVDDRRLQSLVTIETGTSAELGEYTYFEADLLTYLHSMEDSHDSLFHPFERNNSYAGFITPKILKATYEQDEYDVAYGIDIVDFGYAELHNSVSNFGRVNSIQPLHTKQLGVPLVRYQKYVEDDTLSYTIMPIDTQSVGPIKSNRWRGTGSGVYPTLPNGTSVVDINTEPRSISTSEIKHLVLYEAVRSGFDYYLFGAAGPSGFSIVRLEGSTYETHQPTAFQVGAGVDTVFGQYKMYADLMYQQTKNDEDQDFFRGTFGGLFKNSDWPKKIGLNEFRLTAEYARDVQVDDQADRADLIYSSSPSRTGKNTFLGRVELEVDDDLLLFSGFTYNQTNSDHSELFGARSKISDSLEFYFVSTFFDGKEFTELGTQRNNDVVELGLRWTF